MKFEELTKKLETEHENLKLSLKLAIAQAAKKHGGQRPLAALLGKSSAYIANLIQQDQHIPSLMKGVQLIAAAYKAGKL